MNLTNRFSVGLTALLVLVVAAATLMAAAGGLFPQTEYRDWLSWSETRAAGDALRNMITRQEWFSRDFSMAMVHASSQFCGLSIRCLNAWTLAPLALAAPMVFLLAYGLGKSLRTALASTAVWFFSWPTVDAVAWQATVHDRWALFFVVAALCTAVWMYPRQLNFPEKIGVALGGLLLTWLANNSKEASWFVAPTLMLAACALGKGTFAERLKKTSLALPAMLYTTWHVAAFYAASHRSGTVWLKHVGDGDVFRNSRVFSGALFGVSDWFGTSIASGLIVAFCIRWRRDVLKRNRHGSVVRSSGLFPLWPLWSGFALAVFIPMRTVASAPYYMLIPQALLAVLLLETLRRAFERSVLAWWRVRSNVVVVSLAAVWIAVFLSSKIDRYVEARRQTQNFQDSLPTIGKLSPMQMREPPYVLHHPAAVRAPWLLRSEDWRSLWRFVPTVAGSPEPTWLRSPVRWDYTWGPIKRPADDLRVYLYFDEHMKLSRIESPLN